MKPNLHPLILVPTLTLTAPAAVIDSFDLAGQALDSSLPGRWLNFGSPTGDFEAERRFMLTYGRTQTLETTSEGLLEYRIDHPDPEVSGNTRGYFNVSYQFDTAVDLLADGATAFMLQFASGTVTANTGIAFPFTIEVGDQRGRTAQRSLSVVPLFWESEGAFSVEIPFSFFTSWIDLSQVSSLDLDGYRITPGASFQLDSITTVPEPSWAWVSVLTFGSLAWQRRRVC
ncbi:hypothetical protein HNR46_000049 [Haloferula luteola]|uniref:PEP-CTERM protein-sorting domain-containing protein n=1 Tax=Haloferula luteola TaxID=595692 RepID=A0A840V4V8_9BACT|nr:hypothetical protein [Haloferula luteola]MBB5349828.1 hypothetical protein [Haloferula luteola]